MRIFQVAVFSVAANALVLKSNTVASQLSDQSLPTSVNEGIALSSEASVFTPLSRWYKNKEGISEYFMTNDRDNKLGKRMSDVSFPTPQNEEETIKELQAEAEDVRLRLWECTRGDQIVTCHVPVKQTFDEFLKKFEGNSDSVKEKSGLKEMMSRLSFLFNKYDKDRKSVCASYLGRKEFCSEEEMMGHNFVESYKPRDYYGARLLAIEDESKALRKVASVIIDFREESEFDQLVSEIKAANFSPDEFKPLEESISRILKSFEDLENLFKMTSSDKPRSYDYQSIQQQSAKDSFSTEESTQGKEVTRVLEPKDENWEEVFPYDGPIGEADTEGRKAEYDREMSMLRDFSESLEENWKNILTDFKSFWVADSHDYDKFLVARKKFLEIEAFIMKWGMNIRSESQAFKLYEECEKEMFKISDFVVGKCKTQDPKHDLCIHLEYQYYYSAVFNFVKEAEAKLNSVSADISDEDFEDLVSMKERSEALIEIAISYGYKGRVPAERLSDTKQKIIGAINSSH